jgi:hypothetical protein
VCWCLMNIWITSLNYHIFILNCWTVSLWVCALIYEDMSYFFLNPLNGLATSYSHFSWFKLSPLRSLTRYLKHRFSPFYSIVLGRSIMPLGQITLPITFDTEFNFCSESLHFKVADIDVSHHTIIWRPKLAKFMVIPHYTYLVLKMPRPRVWSSSKETWDNLTLVSRKVVD